MPAPRNGRDAASSDHPWDYRQQFASALTGINLYRSFRRRLLASVLIAPQEALTEHGPILTSFKKGDCKLTPVKAGNLGPRN